MVLLESPDSLREWRDRGASAVWLKMTMAQGPLVAMAARHGFLYHHAEQNHAVLYQWLEEGATCLLPRFATHQVGVAGVYQLNTSHPLLVRAAKSCFDIFSENSAVLFCTLQISPLLCHCVSK